MKQNLQYYLRRHHDLKQNRQLWEPQWQLLGEFLNQRRNNFTTTEQPGAFLMSELFDSTGTRAAEVAASAILARTFPSGAKSFILKPFEDLADDQEIKKFFADATTILGREMDDPSAGLKASLDEFMIDALTLSTASFITLENKDPEADSCLLFETWSLEEFYIDDGANGLVDTVYREYERNVRQVVDMFGIENVHKNVADLYEKGNYGTKVKLLMAIEPRMLSDRSKKGNINFKVASVHIDLTNKKIMKESGFEEMPALIGRFRKRTGEIYGRGPGFNALPDVMELNAIWEAVTIAIEKRLDPPLGMLDDGKMGAGVIDTSAGAINTFRVQGRVSVNERPIFPLYDVGNINEVIDLIAALRDNVNQAFYIDRLLDSNDQKQMTLGEAQIRDSRSSQAMASPMARLAAEVYDPSIQRSFNICWRRGKFGYIPNTPEAELAERRARITGVPVKYIPEKVLKLAEAGMLSYRIQYVTPFARAMQAEELAAIQNTWQAAAAIGAVDRLDKDRSIERAASILGFPDDCLVQLKQAQDNRQQQQALEAQMAMADQEKIAAEVDEKRASTLNKVKKGVA